MLDDDLGLSPVRFSVLGALAFHPPMTVGELSRFEHVRSPSMTRLLRDMERDGLVERVPDPADGRRTLVRLTGAGRRLVTTARNRKIAWVAAVLASEERAGRAAVAHVIAALAPLADDDPPGDDPPDGGPARRRARWCHSVTSAGRRGDAGGVDGPRVEVEYCTQCRWLLRAAW